LPLATRDNQEEAKQVTEEARVASAAAAPVKLGDHVALRWQAGTLIFTQNYDQLATNNLAPFVLSPFIPVPVVQTSPQAALDDVGVGVYGQGTLAFSNRVDVSVGARFDHEQRDANIVTGFAVIAPGTGRPEPTFNDVSPQVAVA
jgi:outer membrane receptor protein involved in Fe transport